MRAVTVSEYGGTPVVGEIPAPEPGAGQVLIRMRAAGMNPMDATLASGAWRPAPATFPMVLGADGAGVVERAGEGARRFSRGDELFGQLLIAPLGSAGTYAEYVAVTEEAPLARVPDGLDPVVTAALPTAGGAGLALVASLEPLAGKTVLIVGAGGGVGSFATQFAVNAGARVIANVRAAGDLVFGPDEPSGHRGLRHQEGTGDLGGAQPGQGAERQGDPRLHRQRGVTAGEDQPEPFIRNAAVVSAWLRVVRSRLSGCHHGQRLDLGTVRAAAPQAVDGPVAGHRHQPRPRTVRHAVAWPAPQRLGKGVLGAFPGQVPVTRLVDQGRGDAAPLLAEGIGHDRPRDAGRADRGRRPACAWRLRGLAGGPG